MRKPLSTIQMALLCFLWFSICYIVITSAVRIDGPLILSILISGALVFIPIYKQLKKRGK